MRSVYLTSRGVTYVQLVKRLFVSLYMIHRLPLSDLIPPHTHMWVTYYCSSQHTLLVSLCVCI